MRTKLFLAIALGLTSGPALAQAPLRMGVALPLSGPNEILGRQAADGVAGLSDAETVRTQIDVACAEEEGAQAARRFVEAGVGVVLGFVCTPPLLGAVPILAEAGIPAIDIGARSDRVLENGRDASLVWRLAPGPEGEADALAQLVRERWSTESYALIEDGSPAARDLADNVRERLEAAGRPPSLVENYRPAEERQFGLARRLAQSGVTRALLFGTRGDAAVVARDAAASGIALEIIGGEALLDSADGVLLPAGALAVSALPDVDAGVTEEAPPLEGYGLAARTGAEIAAQALRRAQAESRPVADVLDLETFVTSSGLVRFDERRSALAQPFRTYRWDGQRFVAEGN